MASTISTSPFARCASALLLAGAVVVAGVALRDQRADACGYSGPTIEELTAFDPAVAADPAPVGLQFDPFIAGFGGPCDGCGKDAMLADWKGYLAGAIPLGDWEKLLFEASTDQLAAIAGALSGPGAKKASGFPLGLNPASWKLPAQRAKIQRALAYVSLARRAEQLAASGDAAAAMSPADTSRLLADARAGLKAAKEPFLAQRYAFQIVRGLFYQRDWTGAVAFFDKSSARLERPSSDLAWRARYYVAGALRRSGNLARANLELARIHAGAPALAGVAAQDFQPMEEADWRESLRLARGVHEQAQLWRLVGITQDGLVAAQEIAALDPRSNLLGLLVVRELARAEAMSTTAWGDRAEPSVLAAQQKAYAALEPLAARLATTRGADRPWLMRLVVGHLAARRGDLALARTQLKAAVAARPGDLRVATQAKASLALALVIEGTLDAAREDEIAKTMAAIDPGFARMGPVTLEVRSRLAAAFARSGRLVDAEFLLPGAADGLVSSSGGAPTTSKWADVAFLRELIGRAGRTTTAFDRFVLGGSHSKPALERELAMRQLLDGNYAAAAATFTTTGATSTRLGTDPFVTHIVDCHDCDHATYAGAAWTHASVAARIAELARTAGGKGDPAAQAALALGTALYNLTWYGNARVVLEGTHQATRDPRPAERWYKRAYQLASDRELKARAAFYAAKAELAALLEAANVNPYDNLEVLPVPTTWYPIVKSLADTRYYRENPRRVRRLPSVGEQAGRQVAGAPAHSQRLCRNQSSIVVGTATHRETMNHINASWWTHSSRPGRLSKF